MRFSDLAERQILKAQAEGQLDDLAAQGQPLPPADNGDAAASAGFRIMAEAGALPREITLKKQIDEQRRVLKASIGTGAEKTEMRTLADLELRLAIEQEARRKFYATA
ncbi:MAG: DUF1992 domain-containing protein [Pseudomonadota bacterium]